MKGWGGRLGHRLSLGFTITQKNKIFVAFVNLEEDSTFKKQKTGTLAENY